MRLLALAVYASIMATVVVVPYHHLMTLLP
jgi:hypothetical protein